MTTCEQHEAEVGILQESVRQLEGLNTRQGEQMRRLESNLSEAMRQLSEALAENTRQREETEAVRAERNKYALRVADRENALRAAEALNTPLRARVAALEKLLSEAAAKLESEAQNYEDEARFGRRHYQPHGKSLLAVAARARKLLDTPPAVTGTTSDNVSIRKPGA